MTHTGLTNRVSKHVASRHDASGLRARRKNTAQGRSKRQSTPANLLLSPAANAVTSIPRRSVTLKAESRSTDCSAASKQNPTRFFADSGLLEQRI